MYTHSLSFLFGLLLSLFCFLPTDSVAQVKADTEALPAALLQSYDRLDAVFTNFDFDAHCQVTSFTLVYLPKRGDVVEYTNTGANFSSELKRLVKRARPGDLYLFEGIKVHCPHDLASRAIPGLAVTVKWISEIGIFGQWISPFSRSANSF